MISNFEYRIFVIMPKTILNIHAQLKIVRPHFYCSTIWVAVITNYFIEIARVNSFFPYCSHMLINLIFQGSDKSSVTTKFPTLGAEYLPCHCHPTMTSLIYYKTHCLDLSICCLAY